MIVPEVFTLTSKGPPRVNFELTPNQQVLLMPVGDIHAFTDGWPEQRFRDHIEWGRDRGAWFLGMGDYIDFTSTSQRAILQALRLSQRKTMDEVSQSRVEKLADMMQGQWLGLLEGNHYHEYLDGTTTDQHLCRLLGCPFLGSSTLLDLRLNRSGTSTGADVTIFAAHGLGGGRRRGSHLMRVEDLIIMVEADVYLMGHSHSKIADPVDRLYRTPAGHIYHRTKLIARTGGFLRGYIGRSPVPPEIAAYYSRGGYVEEKLLPPSALGGLVISIGMKRIMENGVDLCVPDIHFSA